MPVQKDGVEGRADEAGKDADRHLSYTQRPGRGVHEQQEDAAHKAVEAPLSWELADGKLSSRWGALVVESPAKPVVYREALGLKA